MKEEIGYDEALVPVSLKVTGLLLTELVVSFQTISLSAVMDRSTRVHWSVRESVCESVCKRVGMFFGYRGHADARVTLAFYRTESKALCSAKCRHVRHYLIRHLAAPHAVQPLYCNLCSRWD